MRALIVCSALAGVVISGCAADQSRRAHMTHTPHEEAVERQVALHGAPGYEIHRLFASDNISDKMRDTSGQSFGYEPTEFYVVQIAPDPTNATVLETAGYARRLEQDRGDEFLYEFYDRNWTRIAILGMEGDLLSVDASGTEYPGKYQLDGAAATLYDPPSGYGYDALQQDLTRMRMFDPEVAGQSPRNRGVYHRSHSSAPPVVVMSRLSPTEIGLLANRFGPVRFNDQEAERLNRLREQRTGGIGQDENYGGLQYKDGQPVDENGRPLHRGSARD